MVYILLSRLLTGVAVLLRVLTHLLKSAHPRRGGWWSTSTSFGLLLWVVVPWLWWVGLVPGVWPRPLMSLCLPWVGWVPPSRVVGWVPCRLSWLSWLPWWSLSWPVPRPPRGLRVSWTVGVVGVVGTPCVGCSGAVLGVSIKRGLNPGRVPSFWVGVVPLWWAWGVVALPGVPVFWPPVWWLPCVLCPVPSLRTNALLPPGPVGIVPPVVPGLRPGVGVVVPVVPVGVALVRPPGVLVGPLVLGWGPPLCMGSIGCIGVGILLYGRLDIIGTPWWPSPLTFVRHLRLLGV